MSEQVQYPCITLQIVTEVRFIMDYLLQIVDAGIIIAAAKIQHSDLIVQHQYPVTVNEQMVFLQLSFYIRHQQQAFFKSSFHEMLVYAGDIGINKCLYAKVIMIFHPAGLGKFLK